MPTIKVKARWTVRATARVTVTTAQLERIKADPELNLEEVLDEVENIEWKDEEWLHRVPFAVHDDQGNEIYEA